MAANTKRTSAQTRGSQEDTGIFPRTSRYREELAEEARTLRRAGKIRQARGVEGRVQQVEQLLGALEGDGQARATPNPDTAH